MMRSIVLGISLLTSACSPDMLYTDEEVRQNKIEENIENQITKQGYALVGETPDGKPLYMKEITIGRQHTDRVYFTDSSIVAREYCGKACVKSVVTIQR